MQHSLVIPRRVERKRLLLAFVVTIVPALGTIAALALWSQGIGPGYVGVALLIIMYSATMFGLEVGYHRLLTHRSFVATPRLRSTLAILGSMAFEGPVVWWVAVHRRHHSFSDTHGDPHSPNLSGAGLWGRVRGLAHAHVGWMFESISTGRALTENFPRDLQRDPPTLRINKHYFRWVLAGFSIPTLLGGLLTWSWLGALTGLLWGGLVRVFLTTQFSFALNSLCHAGVGARTVETPGADQSRDSWLLVIPTFGQGLHNRHHAFPRVAVLGSRWWHFDLGGWILSAFEKLGWVSQVKRISPAWRKGGEVDPEASVA